MRNILKVIGCAGFFASSIVTGMESPFADIYVPTPGGKHFVKKSINKLTKSDLEGIHSQPEYETKLLDFIRLFQMTIFEIQQQSNVGLSDDRSSINSGTISAIHDYLIDEANPSKIPVVCSLIEDLLEGGVSAFDPDLMFFRGIILYNSDFLSKVPAAYLKLLTGDDTATDFRTFGLDLIKRAKQDGCSDATEYLYNIGIK
jgi:hypothetical protein